MKAQEKMKLYPKLSADSTGIKYFFDHNDTHYTIRFAGKPMLILEYLYIKNGGTNFSVEYELAKSGKKGTQYELLKKCTQETQEFLETLQMIDANGLSPFVVYINTFNQFK